MWGATASGFPRAAGSLVQLLLGVLASPGHGFLPSFQASSTPTPPRGSLLLDPPPTATAGPIPSSLAQGLLSRSVSRLGQPGCSLPGTGCPPLLSELAPGTHLPFFRVLAPRVSDSQTEPRPVPSALGARGRPSRVPVRPFPGPPSSLAPSLPRLPCNPALLQRVSTVQAQPPGPRAPPSPSSSSSPSLLPPPAASYVLIVLITDSVLLKESSGKQLRGSCRHPRKKPQGDPGPRSMLLAAEETGKATKTQESGGGVGMGSLKWKKSKAGR